MTEFQPENFTVLFVHHEPDIQELMKYSLKEPGYQVQLADGGEAALSMIASSPPDLILTEVDLEGMSGVELTRQVREHYRTGGLGNRIKPMCFSRWIQNGSRVAVKPRNLVLFDAITI